ncbi:MAG: serine hydrolase [Bryobacteraceae bacterium]
MRIRTKFCVITALVALTAVAASTSEIEAILANRVDEGKKAVAIVVGTISPEGREIVARGTLTKGGSEKVNADSVFEIGSISKVFTALLLADMIERGEVTADTPVAKLLPDSVKVPERNGKQITLLDLSMQISGLPRMPTNFRPADPENPFADYTAAKLYEFLNGYALTRDIGEKYEYSNLGVGLLGFALARKSGMTYEELLRKRILVPLGMTSTSITLSADQRKRLAIGHDAGLNPVKNWDLDALAGAGAIRSTVNDMLKFVAANLELTPSPLQAAMRRMRSVHRDTGVPDLEILMAWHRFNKYGTAIVWHNGGTAGYRTFAGFDMAAKKGVVVLCNTSLDNDDLGRHILEAKWPVKKFEAPKPEIKVDPTILASYAGEYALGPATATVTAEGSRLFVQLTGQPKFELFASAESEFFLKVVEAQVSFVRDEGGKVTHLVLHQNGANQKAMRK